MEMNSKSTCTVLAAALAFAGAAALAAPPAPNPERNAYYGETHLHTSWSFDAYIFGDTKSTPGDAYDYAKGKPLKHAMGYEMRIKQPLDWMGVTDHSEYVGIIQQANTPGTPLNMSDLGKQLIVRLRGPLLVKRSRLIASASDPYRSVARVKAVFSAADSHGTSVILRISL